MDPIDLAKWLKKGIEEEQLYVIPYPEEKESLGKHFKQIVDSVLPIEADPEGTKRRLDCWKALGEMAMEEAKKNPTKPVQPGFGRAKPDLEWVKPAEMRPAPQLDE